MKIAISALGNDLDAQFSPIFGRCPVYVIVDTDTMAFQALPNQAQYAASGAGIQAAQDVARQGVKAVVTGNIGPNAYRVLASAGITVHTLAGDGTVRQAVESYLAGQGNPISGPTGPAHTGMGMMGSGGKGRGFGGGGQGRGVGRGVGFGGPRFSTATPSQPSAPTAEQDEDISTLRDEIKSMQERLSEISSRIDDLK
ncbi:MAG: NifB/NifX family molybdenum-iron cluster-binding protein [Chloroflexota bacterium]|jgi:predicted Fe-Mo cluster-binding NifX family protein